MRLLVAVFALFFSFFVYSFPFGGGSTPIPGTPTNVSVPSTSGGNFELAWSASNSLLFGGYYEIEE